jgi:BASS family bile acid:Na+ symporter
MTEAVQALPIGSIRGRCDERILTAFSSGYLLANVFRVSDSERVSLMFGLGMNNNGAGLVLASVALADHPQVMLPVIFYNLAQHLIASIVDLTLFKSRPPASV